MDTNTEPRQVSDQQLDDEALFRTLTFEMLAAFDQPEAARKATCNFGWTHYCDTDGTGGTCRTGWTFKCDGPVKKTL